MHKRTLRLVYKMEVATFEDLLLKDNSWTVHENNITMLLIELYKSINKVHQSWQIFFTRKILDMISEISNCWNYLKTVLLDKVHKFCFKGSLV